MKRVLVGVRKVEMWVDANWSVRLRYLYLNGWRRIVTLTFVHLFFVFFGTVEKKDDGRWAWSTHI